MKIGIIGAGLIGKTLARKLSSQGHDILISNSKGPESLKEFDQEDRITPVRKENAVQDVKIIVLSIPFGQIESAAELFTNLPNEVIIVETMNYLPVRDGSIEAVDNGMASSAWVEKVLDRPVVKSFNNLGAYSLLTVSRPEGNKDRIAIPVSGDQQSAKELVIKLISQIGFDGYDAGSINDSWRQEPVTPAYCTDLTLAESKAARLQADKEQSRIARDSYMQAFFGFGEEYINRVTSGNYSEGFVDKSVDFIRDYFGLPARVNQ